MIDHLVHTVLGTPGGMRYAHTNTPKKIKNLINPKFFDLTRGGKTIGCIALVQEKVFIDYEVINSSYIRYFSIKAPFREKPSNSSIRKKKDGLINSAIKRIMNNPELLNDEINSPDQPLLVYAYVEQQNTSSVQMVESMGFLPARQFKTLLFSRIWPKQKLSITKVDDPKHYDKVRNQFSNFSFVPVNDNLFKNHFGHKKNDKFIISASIEKIRWSIKEMPGFIGFMLMNVLPGTPILNNLFEGENFEFIAIEAQFIEPGYEHLIADFLESLCCRFKLNKAICWLDSSTDKYDLFVKKKPGLLQQLNNSHPGLVFTKSFNLTAKLEGSLRDNPAYISADHAT
jgi:hypothetical protein